MINKVKEQRLKRMIIFSIIALIIVVCVLIVATASLKENSENDESFVLIYEELKTIEDVIRYYKCKFISQKVSEDINYDIDVRLEFCKPLYEENKSNEDFFTKIINDIARISRYSNIRLLDEKNDIKIEIICDDSGVYNIIINGIEDYFIYMDSQISLKAYKEIKITNLNIEAPVIADAINNQWVKDINLGIRDSIYNQYNIYFDEGIKTRILNSKIYNMIFTDHYQGNVVNGINPRMDLEQIKRILGEPTFEHKDLNIIGYKGEYFYIFFNGKEISVYRTVKADEDELFNLIDEFLNDEIDFLEMMNQLTYVWPDYSEYEYSADKVFLSYPHKGIDVKINYENTTGIVIYNNFSSNIAKVKKYLENTEFMGLLQVDNVFEAEKRRIEKENEENKEIEAYKKENITSEYISAVYNIYPVLEQEKYITKVKFVSKNNDRPNRELNDTIDDFLWANDVYFIFSKANKGIYVYDLNVGIVREILTGSAEFELKSYENGILKYDDSETPLQF